MQDSHPNGSNSRLFPILVKELEYKVYGCYGHFAASHL